MTTSLLGAARYGVAQAPPDLQLVQELLNTVTAGKTDLPDLLQQPQLASEWLRELKAPGFEQPSDTLLDAPTEKELRRLAELRDSIAATLRGVDPTRIRADLRLELQPSGVVDVAHAGRPASRLTAAVLVQAFLAQRSGDWQRLKICANPNCNLSFYDRSKNRSGVWHDVRTCGNAMNLRASRARRRNERDASNPTAETAR